MALPVVYSEASYFGDCGVPGFTIALTRPMPEDVLGRLTHLIESWFEVGHYSGYTTVPSHRIATLREVEYDDEDLWIAWTVEAKDLDELAVDILARILEDFDSRESSSDARFFKELIVGFIVEE